MQDGIKILKKPGVALGSARQVVKGIISKIIVGTLGLKNLESSSVVTDLNEWERLKPEMY